MIKRRTQVKLAVSALVVVSFFLIEPFLQETLKQKVPIKHVGVEGAFQYISKQDIQSKISPFIGEGYFSLDLQAIQESVMSLPWAEKVQVQRVWPNGVKLRLYEQKPVVRWKTDSLLNIRGEIFTPANINAFKFLPVLDAPIEQRKEMLEVMHGLRVSLMDQDLSLSEFRVSDRHSWVLVMADGMLIQLGRFKPLHKFSQLLNAFVVSGDEIVNKIAYVDMRYPNGYSVRWRDNERMVW